MKTIVIGAGAIGLASAYYLRREGHEVTLVDSGSPGAKASAHNAGWVVPSMSAPVPAPGVLPQAMRWMLRRDSPLYVSPSLRPGFVKFMVSMLRNCTSPRFEAGLRVLSDLSVESLALFDALAADGVDFEHHADPLTMLFRDRAKLETHRTELETVAGRVPGFTWRELSRDDVARRLPLVGDGVAGGLVSTGDRSLDPAGFVAALESACRRDGVEFRLGRDAALRETSGSTPEVLIGSEILRSDHVVVAAGVWTNRVLAPIGERVALEAGKGYGFDFPVDQAGPEHPLYLAEAKVAVTPLENRIRIAGTMGFGGIDESIAPVRAGGLLKGLRSFFPQWPGLEEPPIPWTAMRPMTPDGVPIISPLRRHPKVTVATGHAMLGISLAPVTGRIVAGIASGRADVVHASSLAASRFR